MNSPMPSPTICYPLSSVIYRKGFTLVELLVVIAIIGVLATLITVAATAGRQYVKMGVIKTEMGQIEMALERYKNEFGEYPPDFFDDEAVVRHVKKRWPRFRFSTPAGLGGGALVEYQAACVRQAVRNVYRSDVYIPIRSAWNGFNVTFNDGTGSTDKDQEANVAALAFWLGGFPNLEGKFQGFSSDPEAPFGRFRDLSNATGGDPVFWSTLPQTDINDGRDPDNDPVPTDGHVVATPDKKIFYEMEISKNVKFALKPHLGIAYPCLINQIGSDTFVPYVYFRARKGSSNTSEAYTWRFLVQDDSTYRNPQDQDRPMDMITPNNPELRPKYINFRNFPGTDWEGIGLAVPYARDSSVVWFNPDTYQLIHPGLDGKFGSPGTDNTPFPFNSNFFKTTSDNATINHLGQRDMDNIVNFAGQGGTIKSLLP